MPGTANERDHALERLEPYRFYLHTTATAWRLVRHDEARVPPGFVEDDWRFTRARIAADTNADIRRMCDAKGFCLFKLGGTFADVAADVDAAAKREDFRN